MVARFWVGGAGTWDAATTTHWSASTGGAGGASVPVAADDVTFDGASGGGTVTLGTDPTVNSVTAGAFTGTIDFSGRSPTMKFFNGSGTGVRTFTLGIGTLTLTGNGLDVSQIFDLSTDTNLTLSAASSTIVTTNSSSGFGVSLHLGTSRTYGTISYGARTDASVTAINGTTGVTIGTLNIGTPNNFVFNSGITYTITNAVNWVGTSGSPLYIVGAGTFNTYTLSLTAGGTITWAYLARIAFAGTAPTVTNSFDGKGNSGVTIGAPGGGGGGRIIGG